MEKNTCLTLAQAYWVCLQSIFELQKIQQKSCNIALIKSECSYPEIVPLMKRLLRLFFVKEFGGLKSVICLLLMPVTMPWIH